MSIGPFLFGVCLVLFVTGLAYRSGIMSIDPIVNASVMEPHAPGKTFFLSLAVELNG
jgi:hypothetical protein